MVQLSGNNLPKRQHDLNIKVNQAAESKVDFDAVKAEPDTSDVHRLFKIDLAAKYRNADYLLETLKSGDSLYISRALKKATWLCDEEHSKYINTDYLHHHIFPFMSIKMKKKLLTSISMHLNNEARAEDFYNYCLQEKNTDLAYKFLANSSESFKLNLMHKIDEKDEKYLKGFFGNSFTLFEAYLEKVGWNKNIILSEFSHFYNISDVKYLELLEKHGEVTLYSSLKLGLRISKDIIIKHKDRVIAKPFFYVNILNTSKLLRHSTLSDVKLYAVGLLPTIASDFWEMKYYKQYKSIFHAIPEDERFTFLKKIFTEKYPSEEFEMLKVFYDQDYHTLMTETERESWALRHLASGDEILGPGLDYELYEFINFKQAFVGIKKIIMTTTDHRKRSDMLKVLAKSAKAQRDLEELFKYYDQRHTNESRSSKEGFLNQIISVHNVFEFDNDCWEALNKIFYSNDVYASNDGRSNSDYKIVSILYHILHDKTMPDILKKHLESEISMYSVKKYLEKLDGDKKQKVYNYIYDFYLLRIQQFALGSEDSSLVQYIHFILELMALFKKTKNDIPDTIMQFVNYDSKTYRYHQLLEESRKAITESDLVRYLKEDSKLVADKIPEVKGQIKENWNFRLNRLLQKLKIYFPNDDVNKDYLKLFNDLLFENHTETSVSFYVAYTCVFGIFQLSEEKSKLDFMMKFVPEDPKINRKTIDDNVLRIREAICRFACYSRPPVPLSNILLYLKGDYVRYCLPIFNMYLANLPVPLCLKFVESLLDSPVSIQKHGLRLAFECFSAENLQKIIQNAWKNTKNVSLRAVIYKALLEKTIQDKAMYEVLKALTLDLHDEDSDLFPLLTSNKLPDEYAGDFIGTVWVTVESFKDSEQNVNFKSKVINRISDLPLMKKDIVKHIVSKHFTTMFTDIEIDLDGAKKFACLRQAKGNLTTHYIIYFTSTEQDLSESLEVTKFITKTCFDKWNVVISDVYVYKQLYVEFINNLKKPRFVPNPKYEKALLYDTKSYENATPVFEAILKDLLATLPLHEIYIHVWNLRITIMTRKVIKESRLDFKDYEIEVINETAIRCGRQLGHLVKEFVDNKIYFSYFTEGIKEIVHVAAYDIIYYIDDEKHRNVTKDRVLVGIARGLLETKMTETNLLALQIMPEEPECDADYFKLVHDEIRNIPDVETKCCVLQKYYGNYKRMRFE